MIKNYSQLLKVLKELNKHGLLSHLVISGSWCLFFYSRHYKNIDLSIIRTRDVDFIYPLSSRIKSKIDVAEIMKNIGFSVDFSNSGIVRLVHPEIFIDFIVPDRGRGLSAPFSLPELNINAQPLRFQDMLVDNTITINVDGLELIVPHPAAFALHKLLISDRRQIKEKGERDRHQAVELLGQLDKLGLIPELKSILSSMPKKRQLTIEKMLKESDIDL